MKNEIFLLTKEELRIYILLLCAKIDNDESEEEINLIKSKVTARNFDKVYEVFSKDDEDACFDKIEYAIGKYEYSPKELSDLRRDILEVFRSDSKFNLREQNLDKVFDNILY